MADMGVAHGPDDDVVVESTGFRLSWGAVFAGFVVAVVLQIVLTLLGLAIGFSAWEPGEGGVATAVGLWTALAALISLFVGGMTAGRLAGVLTRGDGAMHGVLVFGVATLVNLWLFANGAGMVLGGAFGLLGSAAGAARGNVAGALANGAWWTLLALGLGAAAAAWGAATTARD